MEPEISTRCQQCGAAVRPHTLFCPECGQPAEKPGGTEEPASSHPEEPVSTPADDAVEESEPVAPVSEPIADETAVIATTDDETAGRSDAAPDFEAAPAEAVEPTKDSLSEHLAKLKDSAETPPVVIVDNAPRKSLRRRSGSSSSPKKSSKGRLIFSRFPSLRRADEPRPSRIDPGVRFLIVAAVLTVFALVAFYFSRFLR